MFAKNLSILMYREFWDVPVSVFCSLFFPLVLIAEVSRLAGMIFNVQIFFEYSGRKQLILRQAMLKFRARSAIVWEVTFFFHLRFTQDFTYLYAVTCYIVIKDYVRKVSRHTLKIVHMFFC